MLVVLDRLLETFEGFEVSLAAGQRGIGGELRSLWVLHPGWCTRCVTVVVGAGIRTTLKRKRRSTTKSKSTTTWGKRGG